VTTQNVNGVLVDQGTLPLSSAAGQLAADFIESQGNGRPTLGPEEATNFTLGVAFDLGPSTWTIDYYNIEVTDRVALGANVDFLEALNYTGTINGTVPPEYTTVSEALTDLDSNGVINRQDFVGLDDLSEFRFFSNSFDTTTQGIDIVGTFAFGLGSGESDLTVAFNFNETKVDDVGTVNPIDEDRVAALEDLLPNVKGVISWRHSFGRFSTLLRGNYYGEWDDTGNGVPGIGAAFLVDAAVTWMVNDNIDLIAGIDNIFDEYPDENPFAGDLGQLYSESSPFGFNGGAWYLRARATF
jgi:iron complex outermembrane receptor protein